MTDPNRKDITVITDRSGSMRAIQTDAEGGVNAFIDSQKAEATKSGQQVTLTLVDFDTEYRVVCPPTPIADVQPYTLTPRGSTALLDAIGRAAATTGERLAALPEDQRPGTVVIVVQTDGYENASHEYNADQIKKMISEQENTYGWTFIYLGATADAVQVARTMGFDPKRSLSYAGTASGVAYTATSALVTNTLGSNRGGYTQDDRDEAQKSGQKTPT